MGAAGFGRNQIKIGSTALNRRISGSTNSIGQPLILIKPRPRAPFTLNDTLKFCSYTGKTCCNSTDDYQLQKQFQSMNISDSACSNLVKSVLCAKCDPFSAELYTVASTIRSVPLLCNSTVSVDSTQSNVQAKNDFCSDLWDTCENVSITNSPFAPSLQGQGGVTVSSNTTELADLWQSESDFCNAFGGDSNDDSVCYDGVPVSLTSAKNSTPPSGLCLEKIGNGSYLNMVPHPDGSNRAFFSNQPGKIWLATIPGEGTGGVLEIDESSPFVDLTDEVHFDTQFGMMGMAFHPNFAQNGRFFASFNCDKVKWPGCTGRCSCNSDVKCDPSKLKPDNGVQPCQYQTVIAEYTANSTSSGPSNATTANPTEVRRVFTMGLPFTSNHGGQILFGPADGYLYYMMGDGGGQDDPYNFAQNKKSLLGKIMRLDVDNMPSELIYHFLQWDTYEEVDVITKGGNYGWRVYEGPYSFDPETSPGGNTSVASISPIFPAMGYTHSDVNKKEGSASITGGYFYRSQTDPCMYGSYLYADLYASALWAGSENPENSGNFTTNEIPFTCASDSPIQCSSVSGSSLPALGYIFSFGEDNQKDVYLLASSGVYRVVRPSRCSYTCSKENATATSSPTPTSSPSGSSQLKGSHSNLVLPFYFMMLLLSLFV
ncbi:hypothetical protein ACFE04_023486 [Oxalis oulophora]